jgi:SAM-dependent methyltransferase
LSRGHVTGLDMNPGMLAIARATPTEGSVIAWLEGSALDLPFRSEAFDVVFCQLGLQFFPDQGKAVSEMHRVLKPKGRVALSVYSAIERTPGAYAFVLALENVIGPEASRIKRGEHCFTEPTQLEVLLAGAGFVAVYVHTVEQTIVFPSVLDYVRFQLFATPMTVLLRDRSEHERQVIISAIENRITALASQRMLEWGRFTFQQQAYVAIAHRSH